MNIRLFLLLYLFEIVCARISLDIKTDSDIKNVVVTYYGAEQEVINVHDIKNFHLNGPSFENALKTHFGKKPTSFYLKSPTPWGDLYRKYNWEQITKVLKVKSSRVHNVSTKPVIVLSHDFENSSNKTVKVNTGITQTVENTISTTWSRTDEFSISQEIEYDLNILVAKLSGTTGFSYTSSLGKSEEKSESVTIGTTSGVETELLPGQAVTAVLSAKRGHFEIEVTYKAMLRGNVAVNFKHAHNGHHFWGPPIANILESGGLQNEITETQHITVGFYAEASLNVYDKVTGLPV